MQNEPILPKRESAENSADPGDVQTHDCPDETNCDELRTENGDLNRKVSSAAVPEIPDDPLYVFPEPYPSNTDEENVILTREGDPMAEEYLMVKYKNFVRARARTYFLIGADHEDIVQEGMIGLFKAIRDYRPERHSSFRVFAELCITRQVITAIKTATRQKHMPLNNYVSLNRPLFDEESERTLLDVIVEGRTNNPEDLLISREEFNVVYEKINEELSHLEQEVLFQYLDGISYQEIAVRMNRNPKSIDNALQRVKRKLERYLNQ